MLPRKYQSNEELAEAIAGYFSTITDENPPTITGLALHLGFCSRQSFYDYEKSGDYSYTVKKARLEIERAYEKRLHGTSPTGAIFALKNFGWEDKTDHTIGGNGVPVAIRIERVIVEPNTNTDS